MIGHQAIGQQPRSRPLDRLLQNLFHCSKVGRLTEQPHSPHAPIKNVVHNPARSCTYPPWHAHTIPETAGLSIETTSDPFASSPTPLRRLDPFASSYHPRSYDGDSRSTFVTVLIRRLTACESLRLPASSRCPLDLVLGPGVILIIERRGVPQDDRTDFIGVGRIAPERGRYRRSAGVHEGTG